MRKTLAAIENFFTAPTSPRPLAVLRIGLAAVLILQALLMRHDLLELFGRDGIVQGPLAREFSSAFAPSLFRLSETLSRFGATDGAVVTGAALLYVGSLGFLLLGLFTRPAAIAAWLLHWTFMNSGATTIYGADSFAHVFLFYLMWTPAGEALSVDNLRLSRTPAASWQAGLALRVLQIQLCIVYLSSGIEKAMGPQWWNGELLWRALSLPVYHVYDMSWLAWMPWLSKILGWGTLVVELGYVIFIWPRRTRRLWVLATASLHIGIALFLGLQIFGILMAVLNLCIFGVDPGATLRFPWRSRHRKRVPRSPRMLHNLSPVRA